MDRATVEPFSCIFRRENEIFVHFFSNSEFGMRVYRGKIEARSEGISFYTFLRISPRKINILKKTKLSPRELNELNDMNAKKKLFNLTNILKPIIEMPKKRKKNKSAQNFFVFTYVIEYVKTSKLYY